MYGGFLIQSLPCIGTVINLLFLFQVPVTMLCPGGSPFFSIPPVIPVIGRDGDFLPEVFRSLALPNPRFLHTVFIQLRDTVL